MEKSESQIQKNRLISITGPSGALFFIILAWVLVLRRWDLLWDRTTIVVALVVLLLWLPYLYIALTWAPMHVSFVSQGIQNVGPASGWTFYLKALPELAGTQLLVISVAGLAIGTIGRRWRRESVLLLVLLLITYLFLSVIVAKENRYGLLLCVPIVCFCAMAVQSIAERPGRWLRSSGKLRAWAALTVALILCGAQAWTASKTRIPRIQGIQEVVAFTGRVAPNEPVFYDGYYSNIFTFYLQAGDPDYRRRVVLGSKLLYASAINPMSRHTSYVSSSEDVVQILQTQSGCRWFAIEMSEQSKLVPAAALLRDAVKGPQFEMVRSFSISGPGLDRIDVYRFKLDPQPIDEVDLPFPILGEGVHFKVRPIQR